MRLEVVCDRATARPVPDGPGSAVVTREPAGEPRLIDQFARLGQNRAAALRYNDERRRGRLSQQAARLTGVDAAESLEQGLGEPVRSHQRPWSFNAASSFFRQRPRMKPIEPVANPSRRATSAYGGGGLS